MERSYSGPAIDARYQYITERPEITDDDAGDDEAGDDDVDVDVDELDREAEDVVYATDPEPPGEEHVEGVPIPEADRRDHPEPPDRAGQSTLSDWGGGSA